MSDKHIVLPSYAGNNTAIIIITASSPKAHFSFLFPFHSDSFSSPMAIHFPCVMRLWIIPHYDQPMRIILPLLLHSAFFWYEVHGEKVKGKKGKKKKKKEKENDIAIPTRTYSVQCFDPPRSGLSYFPSGASLSLTPYSVLSLFSPLSPLPDHLNCFSVF